MINRQRFCHGIAKLDARSASLGLIQMTADIVTAFDATKCVVIDRGDGKSAAGKGKTSQGDEVELKSYIYWYCAA